MDQYLFQTYLDQCSFVEETTSWIEIFNYSDESLNTIEEHRFGPDERRVEFHNFLRRRGVFAPRELKEGVRLLNGIRLIVQKDAQDNETFAPLHVSLKPEDYSSMVEIMRLPYRAIEGTSVVGPFFWAALDHDDKDPHLQIIFRKSDVRKKGKTRGWELMLSHSFNTGITSGFVKGTPSSDINVSIKTLLACASQAMHPFLLPMIVLSHDISIKTDMKQREAREWLRRLEHAVSMRQEILEEESNYIKDTMVNLDQINRDLVECHSQVLWKRPQAYQEIVRSFGIALDSFWSLAESRPETYGKEAFKALHESFVSRLDFFQAKLKGIESYAHITLERLSIQRAALYNIIAQKESKLGLQMAVDQRKLAHAAKRDATSMKSISLLGAVFLPATLLASVFSMTFFNFQNQDSGDSSSSSSSSSAAGDTNSTTSSSGGSGGGGGSVSPTIWVYFAITIPVTLVIVVTWLLWDKRREAEYAEVDKDIEKGIDAMEQKIMAEMRKRTMSTARTWNVAKS
ncbi:hypothetical protein GE21DRAFT_4222 [Neurospora crassa]|uniref:Uncharacterized protein n=1 Tax=Neurospora crassa (strain ATCC 24698 / 74-OR23-1A / CBS 708.71 / DSM 1257 / FGSC 987) TaxID=367110 RepID=Q7SBR7_NEUCR|nr:hypothetical protein NCU06239 [Neurospora crassa OR74A]EAA33854.2 hypothetical protein NCU06239 [Neurospora crassa OR74A]KHE87076.1 hypothetical protein GE21DRAFT_4222 [Neurospora crassa]|eukprot:XP_963090.2 hypothetical protein NCU06239 [Neurospora crassa OR74A]